MQSKQEIEEPSEKERPENTDTGLPGYEALSLLENLEMLLRRWVTVCALLTLTGSVIGCGNPPASKDTSGAKTDASPQSNATPQTDATQPSGKAPNKDAKLQIEDIAVGKGPLPKPGNKVTVHYIGKFENGKEFNNSRKEKQPWTFVLGVGQAIPAWDEAVATMRVGGRRKLIVPPHLAYAEAGSPDGTIPPNTTLLFDIELLKIE